MPYMGLCYKDKINKRAIFFSHISRLINNLAITTADVKESRVSRSSPFFLSKLHHFKDLALKSPVITDCGMFTLLLFDKSKFRLVQTPEVLFWFDLVIYVNTKKITSFYPL